MTPAHGSFDFPFVLQPNPSRADFNTAGQRSDVPVAFDDVLLEVDERLALCRNVVVSVRVGQQMVFQGAMNLFQNNEVELICPVTVLSYQEVFVRVSWEVGDDWHRLDENYDPCQGKVVLPFRTVENLPNNEVKLREENRRLKKQLNSVLRSRTTSTLDNLIYSNRELMIEALRNEIKILRAERPSTGLADVPEYRRGRLVRCQNDEDGGY